MRNTEVPESSSLMSGLGERSESKGPVGVPPGKRVLNTHISLEEHTFLKNMANKNSMTVTMFLRNLIRREMQRNRQDVDVRYGT